MSFASNESTLRDAAERIYQYMIADHSGLSEHISGVNVDSESWGTNINVWDWNPGVGLTAIAAYYAFCQRQDVLDYLVDWIQRNKHRARKFQHVNAMVPFNIFPDLYRWTGNHEYRAMARDYGDWIVRNLIRTSVGAIQHGHDLEEEIWADTIFMVVIFLARLGKLTGNKAYTQEAASQLLLHLQYLQDPETGVLFHGYNCKDRNHKSGGRWARGNAWITAGAPMILCEMDTIPNEISARYRRLVDGLLKYQADNGLWHTIMDRPDFYQESSGSAGIAGGILKSIQLGLLPASYLPAVEKAIEGLLGRLSPEGAITGVSGGTPIMKVIEDYNQLACYPTLYGQGLTLMLLTDYIKQVSD